MRKVDKGDIKSYRVRKDNALDEMQQFHALGGLQVDGKALE